MKKAILVLGALILGLSSCQRIEEAVEMPLPRMRFDVTVAHPDGEGTKALKSGWESGDAVYVFFKGIGGKYLKKEYNGAAWADMFPAGSLNPDDFSAIPEEQRKMTAVFVPAEATVTYDSGRFTIRDAAGQPIYSYYMAAQAASYTLSGTTLRGSLTMRKPAGFVQFFVPSIASSVVSLYKLYETHLRPKALDAVALDGSITLDETLPAGLPIGGIAYGGGALFAGALGTAGSAAEYSFCLVKAQSASKAYAVGTYSLTGNRNIPDNTAVSFPALSAWSYGKWVDMGVAGKWATGNLTDGGVGQENIVSPEQSGKYYAWGETVGYTPSGLSFSHSFEWNNYAHSVGMKLTKYCHVSSYGYNEYVDGQAVLKSEDDAATENLGAPWRMPMLAEIEALNDPDHYEQSWMAGIYSVNGYLVTSKENGLSLFLPASGYGAGNSLKSAGVYGSFWSKEMGDTVPAPLLASSMEIYNGSRHTDQFMRFYGQTIRPVRD